MGDYSLAFKGSKSGPSDPQSNLHIPESDRIHLDVWSGSNEVVEKTSLISEIKRLIDDSHEYNILIVNVLCLDGQRKNIHLTDHIWDTSFVRGQYAHEFRPFLPVDYLDICNKRSFAVQELFNTPGFACSASRWFRDIHASLDMRNFLAKQAALNRLKRTKEFFLGDPYFTPSMVSKILELPTTKGTLRNSLLALKERKANEDELCACCDYRPLYSNIFEKHVVKHESQHNCGGEGAVGYLQSFAVLSQSTSLLLHRPSVK